MALAQACAVLVAAELDLSPFYTLPQVYSEDERLEMLLETFEKYNTLLEFDAGF